MPLLGYFIHDTVDIVVSGQARASWEYLVHHVMVRNKGCGIALALATSVSDLSINSIPTVSCIFPC